MNRNHLISNNMKVYFPRIQTVKIHFDLLKSRPWTAVEQNPVYCIRLDVFWGENNFICTS